MFVDFLIWSVQADFVRVSHPDRKFAEAAEDTCVKLSSLVEKWVVFCVCTFVCCKVELIKMEITVFSLHDFNNSPISKGSQGHPKANSGRINSLHCLELQCSMFVMSDNPHSHFTGQFETPVSISVWVQNGLRTSYNLSLISEQVSQSCPVESVTADLVEHSFFLTFEKGA